MTRRTRAFPLAGAALLAGALLTGCSSTDDAAMAQEAAYFKALGSVTGYSVSGDLLDLFAGPDQILTSTRS